MTAFIDFECPFCRQAHSSLEEALHRFPNDVALSLQHLPLGSIHPNAIQAAKAAECAHEQDRFLPMSNAIYSAQDSLGVVSWTNLAMSADVSDLSAFENCLSREYSSFERIVDGMATAERFGVRGTPTIWVNGRAAAAHTLLRQVTEELGR